MLLSTWNFEYVLQLQIFSLLARSLGNLGSVSGSRYI